MFGDGKFYSSKILPVGSVVAYTARWGRYLQNINNVPVSPSVINAQRFNVVRKVEDGERFVVLGVKRGAGHNAYAGYTVKVLDQHGMMGWLTCQDSLNLAFRRMDDGEQ